MIEINKLTLTHLKDDRILLYDFDLTIHDKDKIVIIGEEGNGKSTLLKAIYDQSLITDYIAISGNIIKNNHKIGYLAQEGPKDTDVLAFFMTLPDFFEINPKTINKYCQALAIDPDLLYSQRHFSTFSGGEKIKLQLLYLLLEEDDVLLLDEPSNDLDIETLLFLEDFIRNSDKTIVFISHDETLIQNSAKTIVHLEQIKRKSEPRYSVYKGSYENYVNQRERNFYNQDKLAFKEREELAKKEKRYQRIYERVNHELNTISRADAHGGFLLKKKMHQTKALKRRLDKEKDDLTPYHDEEKAIMIALNAVNLPTNKKILSLKVPRLEVADKLLAENVKLEVYGPKKIAIIGRNGCGKTTLLHIIKEQVTSDLKTFFMPQNYFEAMNEDEDPISFIKKDANKEEYTYIRTLLGSIKFKDDEMLHPLKELSGGQKAKLFFIKMIYEKSEVLILDEPTRNFSPLSASVIRDILKNYNGAIITVSHDRRFLKEVPDIIYRLDEDGLKEVALPF